MRPETFETETRKNGSRDEYFAEQGFCQVLHTCNKYRNRLDKNKTVGNAIRLKLTNLQTALKKLAVLNTIARFALVGTSCFFGNE